MENIVKIKTRARTMFDNLIEKTEPRKNLQDDSFDNRNVIVKSILTLINCSGLNVKNFPGGSYGFEKPKKLQVSRVFQKF